MRKIISWSAIRSGKTITVSGHDPELQKTVKLTHVLEIRGEVGRIIARTAALEVELGLG